MASVPDDVREKHAEADVERDARLAAMSQIERMEEAYRLFRLVQPEEHEP